MLAATRQSDVRKEVVTVESRLHNAKSRPANKPVKLEISEDFQNGMQVVLKVCQNEWSAVFQGQVATLNIITDNYRANDRIQSGMFCYPNRGRC